MKNLKILVSSNGWEYCDKVTLTYKEKFEAFMSDPTFPRNDSEGNPAPNGVILDGDYTITFDEGFEIIKSGEE